MYFNSSFALLADDSPGDSTILSTHQEAVTQPRICDLNYFNQGQPRKDISSSGEGVFENTIDDSLQRLSDLKLSKVHIFISAASLISLMQSELLNLFSLCITLPSQTQMDDQPEQESISSGKTIMNLQTKLHKVQIEKDVVSDLR